MVQTVSLSMMPPAPHLRQKRKAAVEPDPLMRWAPKTSSADQVFGEYTQRVLGNPPKMDKDLGGANSMMSVHYTTMQNVAAVRDAKGVNDIPLKSVGCIPGYSGFIPRRDAANVLGCTCAQGLRVSHKLRTELEGSAVEKRSAALATISQRGDLGASNSAPDL